MKNMFCNLLIVAGLSCVDIVSGCRAKTEVDIDINALARAMEQVGSTVQKVMSNVPSDATKVLFLGTTGIGKSTLINNLMGSKLKVIGKDGGLQLEPVSPVNGFAIGHDCVSVTSIPNAVYDEQNRLVYCDCPGFGDTNGAYQEILNAFAIDQVLTFSEGTESKVKILLMMSASPAVVQSGRAESTKKVFDKIVQIIPDAEKLKEAVVLVLRDSNKQFRDGFFNYLLGKREKSEENKASKKWENWLVSYLKERSASKVFNIPPVLENQKNKEIDIYEKERLIELLQQDPVINIPHNIILDTEECACILEMLHKLGKPGEAIAQLEKQISTLLDSESNLEKIRYIGSFIDEIDVKISSPADFVSLFKEKQNYVDEFNLGDVVNQVQKFGALYDFMKKVCEKMQSSEEASRYFDFEANIEDYCDIARSYAGFINNCKSVKKRREEVVTTNMQLERVNKEFEEVKKAMSEYREEGARKEAEHKKEVDSLKKQLEQGEISKREYELELSKVNEKNAEAYSKIERLNNMLATLREKGNETEKQLELVKSESQALTARQNYELMQRLEEIKLANETLAKPNLKDILEAAPAVLESITKSMVTLAEVGCKTYAFFKSFDKK